MKLYNQYRTQELNENMLDLNSGLIHDTGERDELTGEMIAIFIPFTERELTERKIAELKFTLVKILEDIEQETLGIVRDDYTEKKAEAAEIINELRVLEGKEPRKIEF